jgi:hypothetical protein
VLREEVAPDCESGRAVAQDSCHVDHEGVVYVDEEGQLLLASQGRDVHSLQLERLFDVPVQG